jgi:hypothetical protein
MPYDSLFSIFRFDPNTAGRIIRMSRKRKPTKQKNNLYSIKLAIFMAVQGVLLLAPAFGFSFAFSFGLAVSMWMVLFLRPLKNILVSISMGIRSRKWPCVRGRLLYVSRSKSILNHADDHPAYDWIPVVRKRESGSARSQK